MAMAVGTFRTTIKIDGIKRIRRLFELHAAHAPLAMAAELLAEAEGVMAQSKQIVPVDTGVLRASGHVVPPKITGDSIEVAMVYGGAAKDYAWRVHEEIGMTVVSGQPKYLEIPFKAAKSGLAGRIARGMEKRLKRIKP